MVLLFLSCSGIARSQQLSFQHNGILRECTYHLPNGYSGSDAYALVLNLHGFGSNGFQQQVYSGMNLVADVEGFVVAYPEGISNTWNVALDDGIDDVGFLSALIDTLAGRFSIDTTRVYATGMSMGGFMSHRLACQLENKIAAIASVTGLLAYFPCEPSRPVPVMQIHGTDDPVVPYSSVPMTMAHWTEHNGCPSEPVTTEVPDTDTTDGCTATLAIYSPCNGGVETILYTINGGEHTWPGSTFIIGITNQDFIASEVIWEFFNRYTLAGPSSTEEYYNGTAGLKLFPNPARMGAFIEVSDMLPGARRFTVHDLDGRVVFPETTLVHSKEFLDCNAFSPGIYIVTVSGDQVALRGRLVVVR